jgi:hypothetical protein
MKESRLASPSSITARFHSSSCCEYSEVSSTSANPPGESQLPSLLLLASPAHLHLKPADLDDEPTKALDNGSSELQGRLE